MTKKNIELRAQLDIHTDEDDDRKSNKEIPYEGYIIELNTNQRNELPNIDTNSSNEDLE